MKKKMFTKHMAAVILTLCMIMGMLPSAITAEAHDDNGGYPYNYVEPGTWIEDQWGFYQCECTSFVAYCLNARNDFGFSNGMYGSDWWGDASNWENVARRHGFVVDGNPAVGAVAWSSSGKHGHVAWVCAVNGDDVTIDEYNYGYVNIDGKSYGNHEYNTRTVPKSAFQYIHLKDISAKPEPDKTSEPSDSLHPLQAYSKLLLQESNLNEEEDLMKTHFSICDLNSDGIQELMLSKNGSSIFAIKYYTFENGKVVEIKGPSGEEGYPVWGTLYSLPSRGTYAFSRSGPPYDDIMPHIILEYKLENHRIKLINSFFWDEYISGDNKYWLNGKQCTAKDYQNIHNSFGKMIKLYPNSEINRMYWGVNDPNKPVSIRRGDVNLNGRVELSDAQLALKAALRIIELDEDRKAIADVDNNGLVNLQDAQLILKKALRIIRDF